MKERVWPGIEPTISEVEVEGANQCATLSQTKLEEHNVTQCLMPVIFKDFIMVFHVKLFKHMPSISCFINRK